MVEISYKNALKKTTVEVEEGYFKKIHENNETKIGENLPFIPPLFDEFTIRIINKSGNHQRYYRDLSIQQPDFLQLSEEEKQKRISHYLRMWNVDEDEIDTIYVKYLNATELQATYFEAYQHKKQMTIGVRYENNNGRNRYFIGYDEKTISSKIPKNEYEKLASTIFQRILDISIYMQNRGDFIEYEKIEVGELKKSEPTKATNKPQPNKGYTQKIKLKSKIKKYILSEETERQRKAYRKITPCWYVRGYYQHFGKQKILKYIPPRISYRADEKLKAQQGKKRKPKSREYEIVDNNEQNKKGTP